MRIGVDFDGTIADISQVELALIKQRFNIELKPEQCIGEILKPMLGKENYEILRKDIRGSYTLNSKVVTGCKKALSALISEGHKIVILTSRWADEQAFAKKFLEAKGIPYHHFLFVEHGTKFDKYAERITKKRVIDRLRIGAMIDDTYHHLAELSGSGIGLYFFDQPWNRKIKIDKQDIIRVFGWQDIVDNILQLSAKTKELELSKK